MRNNHFFLLACLVVAGLPFLKPTDATTTPSHDSFLGWPDRLRGKELKRIDKTELEATFSEKFPGRIAKFTDGKRLYILRWVVEPTRRLHPARDCFRGAGYQIVNDSTVTENAGHRWRALHVRKSNTDRYVYERIYTGSGDENWSSVSAWYWSALSGKTTGPWWVTTMVSGRREFEQPD